MFFANMLQMGLTTLEENLYTSLKIFNYSYTLLFVSFSDFCGNLCLQFVNELFEDSSSKYTLFSGYSTNKNLRLKIQFLDLKSSECDSLFNVSLPANHFLLKLFYQPGKRVI